jgi:hypothetical protein
VSIWRREKVVSSTFLPFDSRALRPHLLSVVKSLSCRIAVTISVVNLEGCEHGVVESDIDSNNGEDDCLLLVSFERGRDGEVRCRVSVEDVDEFGLLDCSDHDCSTLGIRRKVLSWHDPTGT